MNSAVATNSASPVPPKRVKRSPRLGAVCLVIPGVAFLFAAFVLPLVVLLSQSIYDDGFTLRYYQQILTDPSYLGVIWTSIKIAVLSTMITILLAYPVS